jgi:hypothetical protein
MSRNNQAISFNKVVRCSFELTYNGFIEHLKEQAENEDKVFDQKKADEIWDKLMEKFQKEGFDCDINEYGYFDEFYNWVNDEIEDCE